MDKRTSFAELLLAEWDPFSYTVLPGVNPRYREQRQLLSWTLFLEDVST